MTRLLFKFNIVSVFIFLLCFHLAARDHLHFRSDGTFKIVQFTDIHYKVGAEPSEKVPPFMGEILDSESPDLVVLTGDIVTSKPAAEGWRSIIQPMVDRNIPWTVTLGNHDDEHDLSRQETIQLLKTQPHSLVRSSPKGVAGYGNSVLQVKAADGDNTALLVYCIDSNAYTTLEGVGTYGWIEFSQIEWYREQSTRFTHKNDDLPLPALAFFHIPVPEYHDVWQAGKCVGVQHEDVCDPVINTGMFAAMRLAGDVLGVFVGHDHENDYAGEWYGICLAYGRVSGFDAYGDLPRGARVIQVQEGERAFSTWIRTEDAQVVHSIEFPTTFEAMKTGTE